VHIFFHIIQMIITTNIGPGTICARASYSTDPTMSLLGRAALS